MRNTKISIGFNGKNQTPLFMVIKEYYENGEIVFAKVLFQIWGRKAKRKIMEGK